MATTYAVKSIWLIRRLMCPCHHSTIQYPLNRREREQEGSGSREARNKRIDARVCINKAATRERLLHGADSIHTYRGKKKIIM